MKNITTLLIRYKKGTVMNMNNTNWVSVWGNAVSIAEHHPEAYAKDITLR